jgi:hypothetical protein
VEWTPEKEKKERKQAHGSKNEIPNSGLFLWKYREN